MASAHDVVVIGGGIIGAAAADELSRGGARVTVLDRGEPGFGCSYGNAGWVTPCFAFPLPRPGMFLKSVGWLMRPDSPLYIRPSPNPALALWLLRFMAAMNQRAMLRGLQALTALSVDSLAAYDALDRETDGGLGMTRNGLLMVSNSAAGVRGAVEEMELVARLGIAGRELDGNGVRDLEPAVTGRVAGGVYFPDEAHLEPLRAVRALLDRARAHGAEIRPNTEVFDLRRENGRLRAVRTTHGWLEADHFVLATGSWSPPMGKALGVRIPVLGGKGYALIAERFEPAPRIPMMIVERKVAVTPRSDSIRLAGTMELVDGRDHRITPRRVDAILEGARSVLSVPEKVEIREVWRGLRPCTPDGIPMIGAAPACPNVTVATGHQMLGLQTAPATGRLVADLVLGRKPSYDPAPFRADRF